MNRYTQIIERNKLYICITLIGLLMPFGFISLLIAHYAVNVPFGDDWSMIPIFRHIDQGQLSFSDIWSQHNEHRIVFPKLAIIAIAYLTHWHLGAEMFSSLILSLVSATALIVLAWRTIGDKILATITSVLACFWLYGTVQWENWLWGWQIEWYMCVSGVLATLLFIDLFISHKKKLYIVMAGVASIIAAFSLGSGILVMPIALIWLILGTKNNNKYTLSWAALFVLSGLAYYFKYTRPADSTPSGYLTHHPEQILHYFLIYIGRPMSSNVGLATAWGVVLITLLLVLLVFIWRRRIYTSKFLPWLAIMSFAMAAACITAFSRVGFGADQAASSRYTTVSLLYIIGLTGFIATLISLSESQHVKNRLGMALGITSLLLLTSSNIQGLQGFKSRSMDMRIIKACTHEKNPTKECLFVTIPGMGVERSDLDYIKAKHWAGY